MATKLQKSDSESFSSLELSENENEIVDPSNYNAEVFDQIPDTLNVLDVYNIASSVGREFERLTDAFGGAVFTGVMPKIIRILEMLETLVKKSEEDKSQISELTDDLKRIKLESQLRDKKQKEELEMLETSWKEETQDLLQSVAHYEEDNKKLTTLLTEQIEEENDNEIQFDSDKTTPSILKLQEVIRKQRGELKTKDHTIDEHINDVYALESQIQRISKLNVEMRQKINILEHQGKLLIEEKNEIQIKLNEKGKSIAELQMSSSKPSSPTKLNPAEPTTSNHNEKEESVTLDPLLANKLVIDLSDPNRPRYTLSELQEVLTDRNQLKARCFLLEDELLYHRGEETWVEIDGCEVKSIQQVPEKKKVEPTGSGIHRFFSFLTGDSWSKQETTETSNKITPTEPVKTHEVVDMERNELVSPTDVNELLITDINKSREDETTESCIDLNSNQVEILELSP